MIKTKAPLTVLCTRVTPAVHHTAVVRLPLGGHPLDFVAMSVARHKKSGTQLTQHTGGEGAKPARGCGTCNTCSQGSLIGISMTTHNHEPPTPMATPPPKIISYISLWGIAPDNFSIPRL